MNYRGTMTTTFDSMEYSVHNTSYVLLCFGGGLVDDSFDRQVLPFCIMLRLTRRCVAKGEKARGETPCWGGLYVYLCSVVYGVHTPWVPGSRVGYIHTPR